MSKNILYYTVSIAGVTAAAPADGFINNLTPTSYIMPGSGGTYNMETGWGTNYAFALGQARGNLRWRAITDQLSFVVNPYAITNIVATGATSSAFASAMNFTVVYDRPDYLYTDDELTPGTKIYNDHAIKRWIARAMIDTIHVDSYPILDPTASTDPNHHYGESLIPLVVGPLAANIAAAETGITVTFNSAISGTTTYPIT